MQKGRPEGRAWAYSLGKPGTFGTGQHVRFVNFRFASMVADHYYVMEHRGIIDQFANTELDSDVEKMHDYLGV